MSLFSPFQIKVSVDVCRLLCHFSLKKAICQLPLPENETRSMPQLNFSVHENRTSSVAPGKFVTFGTLL